MIFDIIWMAKNYQPGFARFLNICLLILKVRIQAASIADVYEPCIVADLLCLCKLPSPARKSVWRPCIFHRWSNRYVWRCFSHSWFNQLILHIQYGPCQVALRLGEGTVTRQWMTRMNHLLEMQGLLRPTVYLLRMQSQPPQGHTNLLYRPYLLNTVYVRRKVLGLIDLSRNRETKYWLIISHLLRVNQTCKNLHHMNLCPSRFLLPYSPSPSLGRLTAQRKWVQGPWLFQLFV